MKSSPGIPHGKPSLDELMAMRGERVRDVRGDLFGKLIDVYYDKATARPEWLGVDADLFGMRRILVPTVGARIEGDAVRIAYSKDVALDTPEVLDREISQDVERHLYEHYGLQYDFDASPTGLPQERPARRGATPRTSEGSAWPDIHQYDPLREQPVGLEGMPPASMAESPGGLRRRRIRGIRLAPHADGGGRQAPELLKAHPEAPWFAGTVALLALSVFAGMRNLRWAVAILRAGAVALLGVAVIEKRRKLAEHEALSRLHTADETPKPSVVQRVKSKVGMG